MSEKAEVTAVSLSDHSNDVEGGNPKTPVVDTVHTDEAMKILAAYSGEKEWTEAEEKKLQRKIDWKLMPVLCLTYTLQYYDKAMISQAVSLNHSTHDSR